MVPFWPLMAGVVLLANTVHPAVDRFVLCKAGAAYRPLAQEIALQAGYGLVDQLETALT